RGSGCRSTATGAPTSGSATRAAAGFSASPTERSGTSSSQPETSTSSTRSGSAPSGSTTSRTRARRPPASPRSSCSAERVEVGLAAPGGLDALAPRRVFVVDELDLHADGAVEAAVGDPPHHAGDVELALAERREVEDALAAAL